ncbi:uncharacterized protein RAG0_17261 [Rhynchosporium agropyri]|uniref:Uncharacterized protein n=1 Tax=Rhynchosporium agropyri TaxID=914238 RepID=A0A1E1LTE7_9HELO|nr:uncharacterized protein RAG0_17261 [Rhynchosporium agropyri]
MRFVTFIFFGLSAFALTQAKTPGLDGDKCTWPNDCKSGCCLAKQQTSAGLAKRTAVMRVTSARIITQEISTGSVVNHQGHVARS